MKNRTPWRVSMTGVEGIAPGDICNSVSVVGPTSPFLIESFGTSPPYCLNVSHQVVNKQKFTFQGLVRQTQKLDTVVDRKLPNDLDSASIFWKLNVHNLSDGSSVDLYMRYRTKFTADTAQT